MLFSFELIETNLILIKKQPTLGVGPSNTALLYIITSPTGPYFPTGFKPVTLLADPKYVRAFPGGVGNFKGRH